MPIYANIGGAQKQLSALYANVGGVQKQLSSMLANIDGASKEIYNSSGGTIQKILSTLPLLSIIMIQENGVPREFYVLRHNAYTSGRTLVMRKNTYTEAKWNNTAVNSYAGGVLDTWFNNTYYNQLPSNIKNNISAVSIPYTPGNGTNTVSSYSCSVFALSGTEIGVSGTDMNTEGTKVANADDIRIAQKDDGSNSAYWTRSPYTRNNRQAYIIAIPGSASWSNCDNAFNTRPAFTLLSSMTVDAVIE